MAQDHAAQVKARQAEMKKMNGAMKVLGGYAKGEGSLADAKAAVATINDVAGKAGSLFPAGTAVGVADSAALPVIWTDTAKFQAAANQFGAGVKGLNEASASSDKAAITKATATLGGACKNCHDNFKKG